jgi:hydrogenase expression/formation protein HypE
VIVSGDIGRHGITIMAARQEIDFATSLTSDCASLADSVERIFAAGVDVHCLRDLTRGGLGAALIEIAETRNVGMEIEESAIPVDEQVRGACEILGLDPVYVACEGRFVVFLPKEDAPLALSALRHESEQTLPVVIGEVVSTNSAANCLVTARSSYGTRRILSLPSGEQLPRIC